MVIIQTQCHEKYGVAISIIISALIWNGFHVMWYTFFYVFPMGLILGYLYYKRKNLWIPILIHIANNTHGMINDYITMNHMTLDEIDMYFKMYKFPIGEIFIGGAIILIACYFLIFRKSIGYKISIGGRNSSKRKKRDFHNKL